MEKLKVSYYQRKARKYNNFSIENYFAEVRQALPHNILATVHISKYESNGIFKRLYNIIEAVFRQGDINHITGDIHYINYFLKRKRTILTVLDCGQLKVLNGWKLKAFRFLWYQLPANKSRFITTISTATKQDLLKYINFNERDVHVIPVCISSQFERFDKEFNYNNPRILQVGVTPNKNLERLVQALKDIKCRLVIIGNVPEHIKSAAQANNVDLVLFDRPLSNEEVVEEYKKADIVTLISTLEGFGMPIVEGNAVGRVVITSNITSMPEVAADAAHLVDPFSVEDMKSGFLKVIKNSEYRNRLIENGYKNAHRFSREKIAEQYTDLYLHIANESLNYECCKK